MKNQRVFWMQVQGATRLWTFQSPLTLELEVERGIWQGLSEGVFRIYNLAPSTRSDIYQDWNDQGQFRRVVLRAGYLSWSTVVGQQRGGAPTDPSNPIVLNSLPFIFDGNVKQAYSQREGPNWVTTICAWDGGFGVTQGDIATPLDAASPLAQQVAALVAAMPNVTLGYFDPSLSTMQTRGVVLSGSPWEKLTQLAAGLYADVYIDLGKVYFVSKGQPIPGLSGGLTLISPASGLLETPMKQQSIVSFEMLFEPRLKVGQGVVLQSLERVVNGTYTVGGLGHRGTISDAVDHGLRTKVTSFYAQGYQGNGAIQ